MDVYCAYYTQAHYEIVVLFFEFIIELHLIWYTYC